MNPLASGAHLLIASDSDDAEWLNAQLLNAGPICSQKKSGFEEGFNRNKRDLFEYGLKDQLNLLAEAFHKYEIAEDTGCQLYIACESSSASHYKNRPLAKTVNTAM